MAKASAAVLSSCARARPGRRLHLLTAATTTRCGRGCNGIARGKVYTAAKRMVRRRRSRFAHVTQVPWTLTIGALALMPPAGFF
jgi:hypothetical protein